MTDSGGKMIRKSSDEISIVPVIEVSNKESIYLKVFEYHVNEQVIRVVTVNKETGLPVKTEQLDVHGNRQQCNRFRKKYQGFYLFDDQDQDHDNGHYEDQNDFSLPSF